MKKLCVITSNGNIKELGGISGPITSPILLDVDTIIRLLNGGHTVYEVNPAGASSDRVRLTYTNSNTVNFFPKGAAMAMPAWIVDEPSTPAEVSEHTESTNTGNPQPKAEAVKQESSNGTTEASTSATTYNTAMVGEPSEADLAYRKRKDERRNKHNNQKPVKSSDF